MREKKTNGHTYLLRRYSVNFWDGILLSDQGSIQPFAIVIHRGVYFNVCI